MVHRTRVASYILLLLVAATGFLAGYQAGAPDLGGYEGQGIRVELYVYKNGELVYYDPDDPATENLGYIIAELIAPTQGWGIKSTDGLTYNFIDTGYNVERDGAIVVSNYTSTSFDRAMYALQSVVYTATPSVSVAYDNNGVYVTISASFTADKSINVTWVGLYANWDSSSSSGGVDKYFMLFADPVNPPVQLNSGDTITIIYKIILP